MRNNIESANKIIKMNPYTYLIIGGIVTLIGSMLATYGLSELKRNEEVFSLSTPASIELDWRNNNGNGEILLQNTSPHNITNLEIYPVAYQIAFSPVSIVHRMQPGGDVKIAERLSPKETLTLPSRRFTLLYEIKGSNDEFLSNLNFIALVVVYRRENDNKRYVYIEPFTLYTETDGKREISPIYSSKSFSATNSHKFLGAIKEIAEIEKVYFKAN